MSTPRGGPVSGGGCPDPDELAAAVEPGGDREGRAHVTAHLATCASCRRVVAELVRGAVAPGPTSGDGAIGRYVLGAPIGAGAMGVVFRARDPMLDRDVAIKIIDGHGLDDEARDRLLLEARALARVASPGVILCHDAGFADGDVFVAMELVEGVNLRVWAASRRPWAECVRAVIDAARGLAAAHRAGVVHRDVKPDNVLMRPTGRAAIGDFGLARSAGGDGGPYRARVAGTPRYLAPEVRAGGAAVPASDQYGFCLTLLEVITGDTAVTPPTQIEMPGRLRRVIERGLAADPATRWPSMDALADELERVVRPPRRRRRIALAAVGLIAAVAIAAIAARRDAAPTIVACPGDAAPEATLWTAAIQRQIQDTLGDPDRWQRVARVAGRAFATFHRIRDRACQTPDAEASGGAAPELGPALRNLECLQDAVRNSEGVLTALRTDRPLARFTADQIYALLRFEPCDGTSVAAGPAPPPAEGAPQVMALRVELVRSQQLSSEGRHLEALALAEQLRPALESLDYLPALAECRAIIATQHASLGRGPEALAGFLAAKELADRAGADLLRARMLVRIVRYHALWASDPAQGDEILAEAATVGARLGDPLLAADLAQVQAMIADGKGDHAAALRLVQATYEGRRQVFGDQHPAVADALDTRAMIEDHAGDHAAASADQRAVLDILLATYGPRHPHVLVARAEAIGEVAASGQLDLAGPAYRALIGDMASLDSGGYPEIADVRLNLCNLELQRDRAADVAEQCAQAVAAAEHAYGPESPGVAVALTMSARQYLGERAPAPAKAIPLLRRAVALTATAGYPRPRADAAYTLAFALAQSGSGAREIRALLEIAMPIYRDAPDAGDVLAELRTWYPRWRDFSAPDR